MARAIQSRAESARIKPEQSGGGAGDCKTIDQAIRAMYEVISGPAGEPRDWERFRRLYLPEARFILAIKKSGERPRARVLGVEDYIRRVEPIFQNENFWEVEMARTTKKFGNAAHVLSSYESRREKNGKAFVRGINSIQMFHDCARWWIASVMWNTERE